MTLLLQYTLIFAAVLMLVALGGCFSEHSGVINLGLEGIMVIGALGGALVMRYLPSGTSAFVTILLTLLGSVTLGVLFSTLLAVACINFKADQTIVGTAMNMLSVAAATVIALAFRTVLKRWAMTNTVLPSMSWSIPFSISASVLVSTEDVASSRISTGGSATAARAIARSCLWPCERLAPSDVSIVL